MIKRLLDKLFYNPNKHIKKLKFITMDRSSILLNSAKFIFNRGEHSFQGKIDIGRNSMIGCDFIFESNSGQITIGNNTFINSGTKIVSKAGVSIGSNVTIAWGCTIYDHNSHSMSWTKRSQDTQRQIEDYAKKRSIIYSKDWGPVKARKIVISDKAWIGFDCIILNGVIIGEGAIVGAGSVVRSDIKPWTVVAGNPAVEIKKVLYEHNTI